MGRWLSLDKKTILDRELIASILPDFLLDYFEITDFKKLGDIESKSMIFEIHLDEKTQYKKRFQKRNMNLKDFYQYQKFKIFL